MEIRFKQLGEDTVSFTLENKTYFIEKLSFINITKLYNLCLLYNKAKSEFVKQEILKFIPESDKISQKKIQKSIERHKKKELKYLVNKFDIIDNCAYIKGTGIKVPSNFYAIIKEQGTLPEHLFNFLILLQGNPIKEIKNLLPEYIEKNNLRITSYGYLVGVRQVWKNPTEISDYSDKIKSLFFKVKTKWKKSPKNTWINSSTLEVVTQEKGDLLLQDAFNALDSLKAYGSPTYRSNYNRHLPDKNENWKVGEFMELADRSHYNVNVSCGTKQLHIRSNPAELISHEYGDTNIIVLINPADVVSCVTEWKFGVCRCYFASIMEEDDLEIFDEAFAEWESDFLEKEVNLIPETSTNQISYFQDKIPETLLNKVDYEKIIAHRKMLLNDKASF